MPVRGLWSSPGKIPNTLSVQWYHMESNGLVTIKTEHSGQGCAPRETIYLLLCVIHVDSPAQMANRRIDVLIRLIQEWRNDEGDFAQELEYMRAAMEGWLHEIVEYAFGEHTKQILTCVMALQELLDCIEARLGLLQMRTEGRWEQIRDAAYELHYNHMEPNEESDGSVNNPGGEAQVDRTGGVGTFYS
ncbi:hypothetical protein Taro_040968 [Colocasia esculenta]|uniref:Uncharacterized protein n=1 Tax=Colocasia esculenta TaxID=4460 RepID=A0A843WUH5_COLES|nr:hypothetical protein [Colocasia esculenta]